MDDTSVQLLQSTDNIRHETEIDEQAADRPADIQTDKQNNTGKRLPQHLAFAVYSRQKPPVQLTYLLPSLLLI